VVPAQFNGEWSTFELQATVLREKWGSKIKLVGSYRGREPVVQLYLVRPPSMREVRGSRAIMDQDFRVRKRRPHYLGLDGDSHVHRMRRLTINRRCKKTGSDAPKRTITMFQVKSSVGIFWVSTHKMAFETKPDYRPSAASIWLANGCRLPTTLFCFWSLEYLLRQAELYCCTCVTETWNSILACANTTKHLKQNSAR
jgi:hypothetical protein